ncbi:MAG: hypothetical protein KIS92_03275 [Planctomycetota bacterium]|nr:hypothetical protein [Planctomycetota bacterium]
MLLLSGGEAEIVSTRVETAKSTENLARVVRFRGYFKTYSGTKIRPRDEHEGRDLLSLLDVPIDSTDDPAEAYESFGAFVFGEADSERHTIETIPTSDPDMLRRFQRSEATVVYAVTGIPLPSLLDNEYRLFLLDLKRIDTALDLVEPIPGELEDARQLIEVQREQSVLPALVNMVCVALGIIDTGDPQYREALEVAVLQGASHGRINGESGRIHTLRIGPPGCGKGLIARAFQLCQPIHKRVEAQCVTEDGLYGNSGYSGGKRVVRAGLIPAANLGGFYVEDVHQANHVKNNRLMITFGSTMELGRCDAANASRTSYEALVAFNVDANRRSDVEGHRHRNGKLKGLERISADTGVPKNILTRFDSIIEFHRDSKQQLELSLRLARRPETQADSKQGQEPGRLVRVVLAYLRSTVPNVEIGPDAAQYLEARYRSIVNARASVMQEHPDYADFLARGSKSYKKLAMAHARLCNRDYVTPADIDAVFVHVARKFETLLTWLVGDLDDELDQNARKKARMQLIRSSFAGERVTLGELHRLIPGASDKSIKRYMEEVCGGARNPDGSWTVPEYENLPQLPGICPDSDGNPQ